MAKIVVIGAAGFLGQNVIPEILSKNTVVAIDKHKSNLSILQKLHPKVNTVHADTAKKGAWQKEVAKADILVLLQAQISSPKKDPFVKNNITTMHRILEVTKKSTYIVHVSSAAVLSVRKDNYAQTKLDGEEILTKSQFTYTVLQPSMMYGVFDNKNIGWLYNFLKKSPIFPIPGSGNYPRQPVYAPDMAKLIAAIIKKKPKNKVYPVNGPKISFLQMVKILRKEAGFSRLIVHLPIPIFIFLMQIYSFIMGKVEFTPDQVKSLSSAEVFEDYPWWSEFNIQRTPFGRGVRDMLADKRFTYMLKR